MTSFTPQQSNFTKWWKFLEAVESIESCRMYGIKKDSFLLKHYVAALVTISSQAAFELKQSLLLLFRHFQLMIQTFETEYLCMTEQHI